MPKSMAQSLDATGVPSRLSGPRWGGDSKLHREGQLNEAQKDRTEKNRTSKSCSDMPPKGQSLNGGAEGIPD